MNVTTGAPARAHARAVVPSGLRPVLMVYVVVAALVFAVLGVVHHGASEPGASDRAITSALRSVWPQPGTLAYLVDGLVTLVPILITAALLAAACLLARQRRLVALALLGPCCVAGATTVLKPLVGRTINGDNLSFPSGHTGYATAVGLVVGLLLVGLIRPARTAWAALLLLVPALVTGALMALDQVDLDAHYPSDTLGGFCTAVAVVGVLALVVDPVIDRWRRAP